MSATFPIIAITGSSGSGTTHIWNEFTFKEKKFPGLIEGDSFTGKTEMRKLLTLVRTAEEV